MDRWRIITVTGIQIQQEHGRVWVAYERLRIDVQLNFVSGIIALAVELSDNGFVRRENVGKRFSSELAPGICKQYRFQWI